ncbi:hypothetical protein EMIHUDRAFT_447755 [Emiliania huxleyi CCMP1516]|uniref:Uncharacterized protein n=2 Tax=Emiliania huxleyi TaxID=2903 RepID=A0A0D3JHJ2_EMIH1|nr:hypothetical protein EMIHUDRAFT_447755 [Emiliania huxleyi CCMP1516]EOD22977.1 hypothetical protein EMIHUDRAFT_447755 [Emiliania huxleyi CCMP1516]|eukprot:XP_005775406.1 hypothetical protein EMIHUDRAFT_447755 [Emiliania huxleyi CCMP1516]
MPPKALGCRGSPSAAQSGEAATNEHVGLFTPDKDGGTHTSCGRAAVIVARRGTVCGEVGLTAPPMRVEFELGGHALLPTGRPEEEGLRLGDRPLRATIVDVAGNPQVLVRAVEGGLRGDEAAEEATAAVVWEAVDALLDEAAGRVGLKARPSGMRLLWLSARRDHCLAGGGAVAAAECDLISRVSAGSRVHHAHTGTALALACAAAVPGTVAHELVRGGGGGGCGGGAELRIAHPQGVMRVHASVGRDADGRHVAHSAGMVRTARYLMVGEVVV